MDYEKTNVESTRYYFQKDVHYYRYKRHLICHLLKIILFHIRYLQKISHGTNDRWVLQIHKKV